MHPRIAVAEEAATAAATPDASADVLGAIDRAGAAGTGRASHQASVARLKTAASSAVPSLDDPTGVVTAVVDAA
jgi:hypothetical protein